MKLREIGEFGLIARIKNSWPASSPQVIQGIGDDAAVSCLDPGNDLVSTVDLLIEDVHFDLSLIDPYPLGRKSPAVKLSDLAAMGATPRAALLSLVLPPTLPLEDFDGLIDGGHLCRAACHGRQAAGRGQ